MHFQITNLYEFITTDVKISLIYNNIKYSADTQKHDNDLQSETVGRNDTEYIYGERE